MLKYLEMLVAQNDRLIEIQNQLLLINQEYLRELRARNATGAPSAIQEPRMYIQDVLDYLRISESTYYRKVRKGDLKPRKWKGDDFFYKSDLDGEYEESLRRGRT